MLDEVWKILRKQRKEQGELRLLLGPKWTLGEGLENQMFTSGYHRIGFGVPISSGALNCDMNKIVKKIREDDENFPDITPNTLRLRKYKKLQICFKKATCCKVVF